MLIWIGNLLALTRLLGYHVKLSDDAQLQVARLYKRMSCFVGIPTMIATFLLGFALLSTKPGSMAAPWFHLKLTAAFLLVGAEVITAQWIQKLTVAPDHTRGIKYKILHGVTGLLVGAILFSVYILRPL